MNSGATHDSKTNLSITIHPPFPRLTHLHMRRCSTAYDLPGWMLRAPNLTHIRISDIFPSPRIMQLLSDIKIVLGAFTAPWTSVESQCSSHFLHLGTPDTSFESSELCSNFLESFLVQPCRPPPEATGRSAQRRYIKLLSDLASVQRQVGPRCLLLPHEDVRLGPVCEFEDRIAGGAGCWTG